MAVSLRDLEAKQGEHLYTSEEFDKMPEIDDGYELIEGRLVKKEAMGWEHQLISTNLQKHLWRFDPDGKLGIMILEVNTRLSTKNVPIPDASFWKAGNLPAHTKGAATRPDLAIEVLSPRDLETKKRRDEARAKVKRYQVAGVSIIWVINPARQEVEVYHPGQIEPVQVLTAQAGDSLDGEEVIPRFQMLLTQLFDYEVNP